MSNNAQISARIKVLEEHFNKSGNTLGKEAGLGNTTVDGWKDTQLGNPTLQCKEFLKYYNINPEWWETGKGEVFITHVQQSNDYKGKSPEETVHMLMEELREYGKHLRDENTKLTDKLAELASVALTNSKKE